MSSFEKAIANLRECLSELSNPKRAGSDHSTPLVGVYRRLNVLLEESRKAAKSEMVATLNLSALEEVIF